MTRIDALDLSVDPAELKPAGVREGGCRSQDPLSDSGLAAKYPERSSLSKSGRLLIVDDQRKRMTEAVN